MSAVRPQSSPAPLRPVFAPAKAGKDRAVENLHENRYVFNPSPFHWIQFQLTHIETAAIPPGAIYMIADRTYPVRNSVELMNTFAVSKNVEGVAPLVPRVRAAGYILNGLMESDGVVDQIPTGLIELTALRGRMPHENPADAELITELQEILCPTLYISDESGNQRAMTALEQLEWFDSLATMTAAKGPIFAAVLADMVKATELAAEYWDVVCTEVRDNMAQRASGEKGYQKKPGDVERGAFRWLGKTEPTIRTQLETEGQPQVAPRPAVVAAPAPESPRFQGPCCGFWTEYMLQADGTMYDPPRLPRRCGRCGDEFPQPEPVKVEEPTAPKGKK